jgi:hypothetical protein
VFGDKVRRARVQAAGEERADEEVELAQETTSYYGKLNWLCYNVSVVFLPARDMP